MHNQTGNYWGQLEKPEKSYLKNRENRLKSREI